MGRKTILTGMLMLCTAVYAQDYKADLERASRIWMADSYEIEMTHHFYPSLLAQTPTETQTVWLRKDGENYHAKYYGLEIINNRRYTVVIHHEEGFVGITERRAPQAQTAEAKELQDLLAGAVKDFALSLGIDSTKATSQEEFKAHYLGTSKGSKIYRFDYAYGQYSQSIVYISAKTGLLEKITAHLREPMEIETGKSGQVKVDIVFNKQISGEKYPEKLFSTDPVFSVDKHGTVTLNGQYSQYRLISHISN